MKHALEFLIDRHTFADLVCGAYTSAHGQPAFVALGAVKGNKLVTYSDWAGGWPDAESPAPFIAQAKLAEMYLEGKLVGLSLTPTPGFERGTGYMGGARWSSEIAAVSQWYQEHDRLLALVLLYSMQYETRLHHVGVALPSEEEMWAQSASIGVTPIEVPAEDHQRLYHAFEDRRSPNGVFWVETQWFPTGQGTIKSHWDFATSDPERFLHWLAEPYGMEPVLWPDAGPNDPKGVVWVKAAKDGYMLGVMARDRWWEVK